MSGTWIKLEHATPGKPEIDGIARALGVDHDSAFGKCVRFWIWADQQSVDGDDLRVTTDFIDRHVVNSPGFSAALLTVGWLQARSGSLVIPRFARHNGQSAKSRALARDRMKRSRCARGATSSPLSLCSIPPPDSEDSETQGKSARKVSRETSATDSAVDAAWAAFDRWCHRDTGRGLNAARGDAEAIAALVAQRAQEPPIVRNGEPVPQPAMIAEAVDAVMMQAKPPPFNDAKWAIGCVRNQLDRWRTNGIGKTQRAETRDEKIARLARAGAK